MFIKVSRIVDRSEPMPTLINVNHIVRIDAYKSFTKLHLSGDNKAIDCKELIDVVNEMVGEVINVH